MRSPPAPGPIVRTARFDRTRRYRYRLGRSWDETGPRAAFVLLNPSTADARQDDPTLRRVMDFARQWGMGRLEIVNLFAWRTPDPRELRAVGDPVGPRNDHHVRAVVRAADLLVVGWGDAGGLHGRDAAFAAWRSRGPPAQCLGHTAAGHPRHPLYVSGSRRLVPWIPRS